MKATLIILSGLAAFSATGCSLLDKSEPQGTEPALENGKTAEPLPNRGAAAVSGGNACTRAASCCVALADNANAPEAERGFCDAMKQGTPTECDGRLKMMLEKAREEGVSCS